MTKRANNVKNYEKFANDKISNLFEGNPCISKLQDKLNNKSISGAEAQKLLVSNPSLLRVNSAEYIKLYISQIRELNKLADEGLAEKKRLNPGRKSKLIKKQRTVTPENITEGICAHVLDCLQIAEGKGDLLFIGVNSPVGLPVGSRIEVKGSARKDGSSPSYSPIATADYICMVILDIETGEYELTIYRYMELSAKIAFLKANGATFVRWRGAWQKLKEELKQTIVISDNVANLKDSVSNTL